MRVYFVALIGLVFEALGKMMALGRNCHGSVAFEYNNPVQDDPFIILLSVNLVREVYSLC